MFTAIQNGETVDVHNKFSSEYLIRMRKRSCSWFNFAKLPINSDSSRWYLVVNWRRQSEGYRSSEWGGKTGWDWRIDRSHSKWWRRSMPNRLTLELSDLCFHSRCQLTGMVNRRTTRISLVGTVRPNIPPPNALKYKKEHHLRWFNKMLLCWGQSCPRSSASPLQLETNLFSATDPN